MRLPSLATWALCLTSLMGVGCSPDGAPTSPASPAVVDDPALTTYVQSVADAVGGAGAYHVTIYDIDYAQAFALPDNEIALTLGMLALIQNEAELACVLGHEMAHEQLGHVAARFADGASTPLDAAHPLRSGWPLPEELAADALGTTLCANAGYDPEAAPDLLVRATRAATGEGTTTLRAGPANPQMERAQANLDLIGAEGLDGGNVGTRPYVPVHRRLAEIGFGASAPGPAGAPTYLGETVEVATYINDHMDEFEDDMGHATGRWLTRECAQDDVTTVPSNYWDAFGHCWAGCRAAELCDNECLNPGLAREVYREGEDIFGVADHDSFWQDWFNQEVGFAARDRFSATESCEDICTDLLETGYLDLSAPMRVWADCESHDNTPERPNGSTYTRYGSYPSRPSVYGEPHILTADGLSYYFNAAGEFVATRSVVDDFTVQVRFEAVPPPIQASEMTAVAANLAGDRVGVYVTLGGVEVRVNGSPADPNAAWVGLQRGGFLQVDDHSAVLRWPDDTELRLVGSAGHLDMSMSLAPQRKNAVVGLWGNADGDASNEYITRAGAPVAVPATSGPDRRDAIYGVFGESWRITPSESLFDYGVGESTDTFQHPAFPATDLSVGDLDPSTAQAARMQCVAAGVTESPWLEGCTFDVGLTGDASWAESARWASDPEALTPNDMYLSSADVAGPQTVRLERFAGTAGQTHFFRITHTERSLGLAKWRVVAPSGAVVFQQCVYECNLPGAFVLNESGVYTSELVADTGESGHFEVVRDVVPDPQVFDLGAVTSVALETAGPGAGWIRLPGEEDRYRFSGSSGETVTLTPVHIDGSLYFGEWRLVDPNGTEVFRELLPSSGGTPKSTALALDGTYTLSITGGNSWPAEYDAGYGHYRILLEVSR